MCCALHFKTDYKFFHSIVFIMEPHLTHYRIYLFVIINCKKLNILQIKYEHS